VRCKWKIWFRYKPAKGANMKLTGATQIVTNAGPERAVIGKVERWEKAGEK
jgi:hypothetical protein